MGGLIQITKMTNEEILNSFDVKRKGLFRVSIPKEDRMDESSVLIFRTAVGVRQYRTNIVVPPLCPYCLKQTDHELTLESENVWTSVNTSSKTSKLVKTKEKLTFYCCPDHTNISGIKMLYWGKRIDLYFKNYKYAALFASMNKLDVSNVSKANLFFTKVLKALSYVFFNPRLAAVIGLLIIWGIIAAIYL